MPTRVVKYAASWTLNNSTAIMVIELIPKPIWVKVRYMAVLARPFLVCGLCSIWGYNLNEKIKFIDERAFFEKNKY